MASIPWSPQPMLLAFPGTKFTNVRKIKNKLPLPLFMISTVPLSVSVPKEGTWGQFAHNQQG